MSRPMFTRIRAGLTALALCAIEVQGRCSHGLAERGLAQYKALQAEKASLSKRELTLKEQEQMLNPSQECSYYSNDLVNSIVSGYPANWEIATIVNGDTEAQNAYNAIINDPEFPSSIQPRGTPQGDFSGVNYDGTTDPDCWWTYSRCVDPKGKYGLPADVSSCPEPNTWGLTYDDGPNCTHNAFYNYLQDNNHTATLFYIGSNVMNWPLQAMRGIADGHEIGVHTWSHRYATALTNEQFFAELWYSRKAIKEVVGVTPMTWRPPYGDVDDRIRFIAYKLNLTTVIWDHDSFDWSVYNQLSNPNGIPTASVVANYDTVYGLEKSGQLNSGGVIVLTHELDESTMDIAMSQLPQLSGTFKYVVPVTTCRNISQPYVEKNYTYPTFSEWVAGDRDMTTGVVTTSSLAPTSTPSRQSTASGIAAAGAAAGTSQPSSQKHSAASLSQYASRALAGIAAGALMLSLI